MSAVFLLSSNELENRWDVLYYLHNLTSLLKNTKYEIVSLKNVIKYAKSGFASGKQDQSNANDGIIQIRPTNLDENGILKFEKNIYVPKNLIETRETLQKGEVLFNNTNSQELVGKTTYFDLDGNYFCSNHITRILCNKKIYPQYLMHLLNLYQSKKIFFNTCTNWNNQSGVGLDLLLSYKIPLPPKQNQQQIIDIMDNAYQVKKDKEQQAKGLLDSIDEYLLDELGIVMPAKSNNTLENRIFMQSFSNISDTRFDPSYHQKYYQDLEKALQKAKYPLVKLAEKLLINNVLEDIAKYEAINYIDLSSIDKENGIIENIKNINNNFPSRARQKVCKGDLLVSTLSGSMKAIAIVNNSKENLIASTGFFVIRHTNGLLKDFLMFLLRINLFQELLKRESSGAIMASINQNKFLNLKIPLPSLTEQKRIANEIRQRQERAKKLQQEAKEILESAKKQVENMILGG